MSAHLETVQLKIPGAVWYQLAKLAERQDRSVADEIADAIKQRIGVETTPVPEYSLPTRSRVESRVLDGWSDRMIAEALLMTRELVGKYRREAGLRANRDKR